MWTISFGNCKRSAWTKWSSNGELWVIPKFCLAAAAAVPVWSTSSGCCVAFAVVTKLLSNTCIWSCEAADVNSSDRNRAVKNMEKMRSDLCAILGRPTQMFLCTYEANNWHFCIWIANTNRAVIFLWFSREACFAFGYCARTVRPKCPRYITCNTKVVWDNLYLSAHRTYIIFIQYPPWTMSAAKTVLSLLLPLS